MRICIFYMQNDVRNIEKWFKNKAGEVDFWLTSSLKNTRFVDLYQILFDDCYQKPLLLKKNIYASRIVIMMKKIIIVVQSLKEKIIGKQDRWEYKTNDFDVAFGDFHWSYSKSRFFWTYFTMFSEILL